MYHIKQDKRSLSSAEGLVNGLLECLKEKPLKAVTVSDLHRITGISRATFYRLFDTPEDVLIYKLEQMTDRIAVEYPPQCLESTETLLEYGVAMSMAYHEFVKAIIENGRFDLLYRYTEKIFRSLDAEKTVFPRNPGTKERDYVIAYLSMTMVASLITWNRHGRVDTPGDIVRYLKSYSQGIGGMLETETESAGQ